MKVEKRTMKVCRICLAADRKMFVLDTKHKQIYESVTGITVQPDQLPKHICWECRHFMSKYYTFKSKAVKSHCILMKILTKQNINFTTLEKHQPKSTLTRTGILYSNLDGVNNEELDEIAAVNAEGVIEFKIEADSEGETNFTSCDNSEINVIRDNTPIDYMYDDANLTTKVTRKEPGEIDNNVYVKIESIEDVNNIEIFEEIVRNENEFQIIEKPVKSFNNLEITSDSVQNNIDIETTKETVENPNNILILDNFPQDYTDDDENESMNDDLDVSNKSDSISCRSVKNTSSARIDEISQSKKKFGLNETFQTVTMLSKEEYISEMKMEEENSSCFKEFLDRDPLKIPADGPHCERCDLRFASQKAFDNHKICSTNHADKRTTKITPRLTEPMVVNEIQFAKSPRVELRKYYAPPGYPPLFGASLKKPKADSPKVKNSSKTSNEAVYSDANIAELSKRTKHLEEPKEKAYSTETVVGDKNNSLIESCKDKLFICDKCGQQFNKKDYIILHLKTKHVKDIDIRYQKYAYSSVTKDRLQKHTKLNCEKRKCFCDECNNRFISKNILKQHKQRCGIKNNVSNTHAALESYSCTKYGNKFSSKHSSIKHMRTHTGEKPYSCTVCKKQFIQTGDLNKHMRTHTGEKPFSYTVCKKQFIQIGDLNKHMRTHTGEKPYSCTVCKKQFSESGHMNTHMRTHTGETPYSCTVCKKHFSKSGNLDAHMRSHTGEKPYSCTVCQKQFSESGHLNTHMRTHTGKKPYSCTVCKKQFSVSGTLNTHMRTHTGEKPYSCTVCKKLFSVSSSLNAHMRTHTGEKPYSCTVCKKQFSVSGSLNKHMRTHTGEKPYSCTVCKKQFIERSSLNKHMRTHTGEKPYSCSVCKKRFSDNSSWRRHSRKCH